MAYSFYRTITLDHTKCGASDSSNFPIVVTGTYTYLRTVANGGLVRNSSGFDIGFFSDVTLTTPLKWETVVYTPASGLVEFWVKIPTVSHTVDTVIYMAYGDVSIVSFQGGAQGSVWASAARIYHVPDGTTLGLNDSSTNNKPLTNHTATAVVGQIDGGTGTASGKYLHDDDAGVTSYPGAPFTFSAWIKTTQAVNAPFATFGQDTGSNQCALYLDGATGFTYIANGGTFTTRTTTAVNDGNWHYLVGVADANSGANNSHMYFDGALQGTGTVTWAINIFSATDNLTIGRLGGGTQPMTASQDEIHIIGTNRGADWILTEYNNQFNPATFYTIGVQHGSGGGGLLFDTGGHQVGNPGLRY